jgi:pyruvate/2-oxoglutarate dehydrogenase complex dihydrolipoamide dehydrogenase (E3) component
MIIVGYDDDSHAITNINHDTDDGDSMFHVLVKDSSGKSAELLSDRLLIAAGRIPNSDTLDLEKTGVKINKKKVLSLQIDILRLLRKEYLR